ncbi:MAG: hypothetical protein M0Z31_01750 [Clostridia bacterium]|nr:hypothetical protein [Clostridia bacterium]
MADRVSINIEAPNQERLKKLSRLKSFREDIVSRIQPIPGTPLQEVAPAPLLREHRLYQADFLLRQYRFTLEEMAFDNGDNLSLEVDPKAAAAVRNIHRYPLEVNMATYYHLLRIPGIGPLSASRIVKARRTFRISSLEELKSMGVVVKRAAPFLLINGKHRASLENTLHLQFWRDNHDLSPPFPTPVLPQSGAVIPGP